MWRPRFTETRQGAVTWPLLTPCSARWGCLGPGLRDASSCANPERAWVNVQAGYLDEGQGPVQQPVPYGALPRLALAHLSTHAVRHKTREIPIGDSAAQFLELMGMDTQGARYANLRRQMHALAACRLQLGYKGRTFNGQAIEQFDAWLVNKETKQRSLWPGLMVLTEHFYSSLLKGAVPLDLRALHVLKGSALALDVYAWLAYRLHRIEGQGVTLHWASLREQFAQEYTGKDANKNFKGSFLPQLRKVLTVYPQSQGQSCARWFAPPGIAPARFLTRRIERKV